MTIYGGKKQRIQFHKETTWGADPSWVSGTVVGLVQGSPSITADNQLVNVFAGGLMNSRAVLEGATKIGARIEWYPVDVNFMMPGVGDFDSTSPVANGGSTWVHRGGSSDSTTTTVSAVENSPISYTMKIGIATANKNITFVGCKTNSLTINLTLDEPLKCSADIIAKEARLDTDVKVVSSIADEPLMYHRKGRVLMSGIQVAETTNISMTINQNLQTSNGIQESRNINALEPGNREITGSITLNYDGDDTEAIQMFGGSTISGASVVNFDTELLLDNNKSSIASGYRGIYIKAENMKLGTLERTHPVEGGMISETYDFTARDIWISGTNATSTEPW